MQGKEHLVDVGLTIWIYLFGILTYLDLILNWII